MFGGPFRPYSDPVTQVSSYLKIATFRFDYGHAIECEYEYVLGTFPDDGKLTSYAFDKVGDNFGDVFGDN